MARELGDPAGEALALVQGAIVALNAGDFDGGLQLASQAQQITAGIPGWIARGAGNILTAALIRPGTWPPPSVTALPGLRGRGTQVIWEPW